MSWALYHCSPEAMKVDGFDDCIIGVGRYFGSPSLLVYSTRRMLDVLVSDHGMTEEEAEEYFEFNITGAYVGEGSPIFLDAHEDDEDELIFHNKG